MKSSCVLSQKLGCGVVSSSFSLTAAFWLFIGGPSIGTAQSLNTVLQLHMDSTEVSGTANGSVISPSIAPAGYTPLLPGRSL